MRNVNNNRKASPYALLLGWAAAGVSPGQASEAPAFKDKDLDVVGPSQDESGRAGALQKTVAPALEGRARATVGSGDAGADRLACVLATDSGVGSG